MERLIQALLVAVGVVNFLPVAGLLGAETLANAYGIAAPEGDLLILMRHRALLFGIVGALIIASAFRRHLRPAAIAAGSVSMIGFIILALDTGYGAKISTVVWIDVVASMALVAVAVLHFRASSASRRGE